MASEMVERVQSALNEIIPKWLAEDGSLGDDAPAIAVIIAIKECAENEGEASTVYFLSGALEVE